MCEIEISHMGKNNGNPNLVCEKVQCILTNELNMSREAASWVPCILTEDNK